MRIPDNNTIWAQNNDLTDNISLKSIRIQLIDGKNHLELVNRKFYKQIVQTNFTNNRTTIGMIV